MSQVINTNVASLNAQRNLNESQGGLQTSLERLSSGLRINSAGDDAAGLAISERFSAQISGLEQAQRNSNDGISFAQTAEGGLDEIGNLLQRVRELSVQAANDTNSNSDRAALNEEVQQAVEEINRIAASTQFNDQNVLDGALEDLIFQVGANAGQTIGVDGVDSRGSNLGAVISQTSDLTEQAVAADVEETSFDFSDFDFGGLDGDTGEGSFALEVNGQTVETSDVEDVESVEELAAAINDAIDSDVVFEADGEGNLVAINQGDDDVNVELAATDGDESVVGAAVVDDDPENEEVGSLDGLTTDGTADVVGEFTVNGEGVEIDIDSDDVDGEGEVVAAMNSALDGAGFSDLSVSIDGDDFELTNESGSTVEFTFDLSDGSDPDETVVSAQQLDASEDVTLADQFSRGETVTFDVEVDGTTITVEDAASLNDVVSEINAESSDTGVSANLNATNDAIVFSADRGENFDVSLTVDGQDGRDGITEEVVATAEDNSVFVNDLSVTTRDEATETITAVDFAIDQVNGLRGDLGATQNRFESTISNLSITTENLQASRSRIVDADFAAETADLTRAQILQQAGTSVLAQANQIPQNVVSLLQ